jgi:hypothetical protein
MIACVAGVDKSATNVGARSVVSVERTLFRVELPTTKNFEALKVGRTANEPTPALKVLYVFNGFVTKASTAPFDARGPGRTNNS